MGVWDRGFGTQSSASSRTPQHLARGRSRGSCRCLVGRSVLGRVKEARSGGTEPRPEVCSHPYCISGGCGHLGGPQFSRL